MTYLLDTCVLSEARRRQGHSGLKDWLRGIPETDLFISSLTLGEIQQGIARLTHDLARQQALQQWLETRLRPRFQGRVLAIDAETALNWGQLSGRGMAAGDKPPVVDALLAATAMQHNLVLVTHNIRDFVKFPIQVFDPWAVL